MINRQKNGWRKLVARVVREMSKDPDLISLRNDPRFNELVAYANSRASSKPKSTN